jgi:LTXXQ motif family protein
MSRFHVGIAVLGVSLVLLVNLLASPAPARGLHLRMGGGPIGIVRSVASLALRGLHGRRYAGRSDRVRLAAARDDATTVATPRGDVTRSADWVTRPIARVQVAAGAALAGWHGRRGASGWWQHGDGGYGWVGPLFWPFAYYDIYDYTLWGDGMGFWGYGYRDIYAAIFTPYGEDELERYLAPSRNRRYGRGPSLAQICGDDATEVASLPTEQLRQTIQPTDEQRAALDDLANASLEAAQTIRAACPTEVALTPSGRLAAMQRRLEAMEAAVSKMRPSLEKFYELLEDEQKGKLNAFANQRSQSAPKVPATQSCTPPGTLQWPVREIEARLNLNDAQRAELEALQHMSERANNILNFDCQPDEDLAPPDRLATADVRLDAMLDAIKLVRPALEDFFAALSDEQKAQFATIGAKRTS